jgi:hypothetical protein
MQILSGTNSMHNPKLEILGCDNSTPLNRNLIPRFEDTREKDKVDLQFFTLPSSTLIQ